MGGGGAYLSLFHFTYQKYCIWAKGPQKKSWSMFDYIHLLSCWLCFSELVTSLSVWPLNEIESWTASSACANGAHSELWYLAWKLVFLSHLLQSFEVFQAEINPGRTATSRPFQVASFQEVSTRKISGHAAFFCLFQGLFFFFFLKV